MLANVVTPARRFRSMARLAAAMLWGLLAMAAPAGAEPREADAQAAVAAATRYLEHFRLQQWRAAADMVHPESLSRLKQALRPLIDQAGARTQVLEQLGVATVEELDALPERELYARLLARASFVRPPPPRLANVLGAAAGAPMPAVPAAPGAMPDAAAGNAAGPGAPGGASDQGLARVLGAVRESDDAWHVVYLVQRRAGAEDHAQVLSLRRDAGQWRIVSRHLQRRLPFMFAMRRPPP